MKKLLIVSNCQWLGLSNCLSLLMPGIGITSIDAHSFLKQGADYECDLREFDYVVAIPELDSDLRLSKLNNVMWMPGIFFPAYHPDMCNVKVDGANIKGPLDDYHSGLIIGAYIGKLDVGQTICLFNEKLFSKLGYLNRWTHDRNYLILEFKKYGFDIRSEFIRWVRHGVFMHSFNHPRIEAIFGLSRLIAEKITGKYRDLPIRPHDNLCVGPVFPVYPGVAERLGVNDGGYYFKRSADYQVLDLEQFVVESFHTYSKYDPSTLESLSPVKLEIAQMVTETR